MKFVRFMMRNPAMLNVPKHIDHYAKFSPSPLSMKQFVDFGEFNIFKIYLLFYPVTQVHCNMLCTS